MISGFAKNLPKLFRISFVRFVAVGALCFAIDAGMLYVLHGLCEMPIASATVLSFLSGFLTNFLINRRWVFHASSDAARQFRFYVGLAVLNLFLTVPFVTFFSFIGFPYLFAKTLCTAGLVFVNYYVSKRVVYAPRPPVPEKVLP